MTTVHWCNEVFGRIANIHTRADTMSLLIKTISKLAWTNDRFAVLVSPSWATKFTMFCRDYIYIYTITGLFKMTDIHKWYRLINIFVSTCAYNHTWQDVKVVVPCVTVTWQHLLGIGRITRKMPKGRWMFVSVEFESFRLFLFQRSRYLQKRLHLWWYPFRLHHLPFGIRWKMSTKCPILPRYLLMTLRHIKAIWWPRNATAIYVIV